MTKLSEINVKSYENMGDYYSQLEEKYENIELSDRYTKWNMFMRKYTELTEDKVLENYNTETLKYIYLIWMNIYELVENKIHNCNKLDSIISENENKIDIIIDKRLRTKEIYIDERNINWYTKEEKDLINKLKKVRPDLYQSLILNYKIDFQKNNILINFSEKKYSISRNNAQLYIKESNDIKWLLKDNEKNLIRDIQYFSRIFWGNFTSKIFKIYNHIDYPIDNYKYFRKNSMYSSYDWIEWCMWCENSLVLYKWKEVVTKTSLHTGWGSMMIMG